MDGGSFDAVEKIFCFEPRLWEVSSACGRTRYFPRAGKYPKGAGGGQRVHVAWPPPVPPLLSYSAPLASQGRAQLGYVRPWEGHCRLQGWLSLRESQVASRPAYSPLAKTRPGAADPSPGSWAPVYPWSVGKGPLQQYYLAAVRAPTPGPCRVRVHCGTRLVAGPRPNQM